MRKRSWAWLKNRPATGMVAGSIARMRMHECHCCYRGPRPRLVFPVVCELRTAYGLAGGGHAILGHNAIGKLSLVETGRADQAERRPSGRCLDSLPSLRTGGNTAGSGTRRCAGRTPGRAASARCTSGRS